MGNLVKYLLEILYHLWKLIIISENEYLRKTIYGIYFWGKFGNFLRNVCPQPVFIIKILKDNLKHIVLWYKTFN